MTDVTIDNQKLTLNEKNSNTILAQYLDIGYKNSKIYSIKDGSIISKLSNCLKDTSLLDPSITKENFYKQVYTILEQMNKAGSFSLGDSALLESISVFLSENVCEKEQIKEQPKERIKDV